MLYYDIFTASYYTMRRNEESPAVAGLSNKLT